MTEQSVRLTEKRYVVAIPVPSLDLNGAPLETDEIDRWTRRALLELTACFGGATPIPAAGMNVLDGQILYEKGQIVIYAGCDSREAFLAQKSRLEAFAQEMRRELRQYAVFVLACPSDSFLVEISTGPRESP